MSSLLAVLRETASAIERSGHAFQPRREAEALAASVLAVERSWLLAHGEQPMGDDAAAELRQLAARRVAGEPIAYIVGYEEFRGRRLRVTPAVLVPRPETEQIVDLALRGGPVVRALDVGTGSGALAISLALESGARVVALDVAADALAVAAANATVLRAPVAFVRGDGLGAIASASVDLVVANPPYVAPAEWDDLPVEVRRHEPRGALLSPPDGLGHLRAWLPETARVLRPGGRLLFEIGFGQAPAAVGLATGSGLQDAAVHPDFRDIPRVLEARRRP